MATAAASLPAAYRLYLPENWAGHRARRRKTGVPKEIVFQTKQEIALNELRRMVEENVPRAPVVADAAYGADNRFRAELEAMGLTYCMEIESSTSVWPRASAMPLSRPRNKVGRPPKIVQWDALRPSLSTEELVSCLCEADLRRVGWREGARGTIYSRFARLRVHATPYWDEKHNEQRPEGWLLVEWPVAERRPTKYWLSNLPESIALQQLVTTAKMNWVAERDNEELKQALGLDQYEGRNWRGFHHHATLCVAAYGFLVIERHLASLAGGIAA
jgi:SRSO17 transposase